MIKSVSQSIAKTLGEESKEIQGCEYDTWRTQKKSLHAAEKYKRVKQLQARIHFWLHRHGGYPLLY